MKKYLLIFLISIIFSNAGFSQSNWSGTNIVFGNDSLIHVDHIEFDSQNRPWVYGQGAACSCHKLLRFENNAWVEYPFSYGSGNLDWNFMLVNNETQILFYPVGHYEYVVYDIATGTETVHFAPWATTYIDAIKIGNSIYLSYNEGIAVLDTLGNYVFYYDTTAIGTSTCLFSGFAKDSQGRLFFSNAELTGTFIYQSQGPINQTSSFWKYDPTVLGIPTPNNVFFSGNLPSYDNNIFLLGNSSGTDYLIEWRGPAYALSYNPSSVNQQWHGLPQDLVTDNLGNVWISLVDSGLMRFSNNAWENYPSDTNFPVIPNHHIAVDRNNTLVLYSINNFTTGHLLTFFNASGRQIITGKVYDDVNQNGTFDSGETGLRNQIVQSNLGYYTTSDTLGNYSLYFPDSSQLNIVSPELKQNQLLTSTPTTYQITPNAQPTNNANFGIYTSNSGMDFSVTGNIFPARPGFNSYGGIDVFNKLSITSSDTVTLNFDSQFTFVSANPSPLSISGNTVKWLTGNITRYNTMHISITLNLSSSTPIGTPLLSSINVGVYGPDIFMSDNYFNIQNIVTGSFDPNDKQVSNNALWSTGTIGEGFDLYYTINFQNTGTDTAFTVQIIDTLDVNLDISTFEITGYSHNVITQMTGAGILKFSFYNIMLADSNLNEPLSHGYVSYKIKTKNTLNIGDSILNTGYIYFDFNSPIVTNATHTVVSSLTGVNYDNTYMLDAKLLPNPFSVNTRLFINNENLKRVNIVIRDLTGRVLVKENQILKGKEIIIQRNNLPSGLYLLEVCTELSQIYKGKVFVD